MVWWNHDKWQAGSLGSGFRSATDGYQTPGIENSAHLRTCEAGHDLATLEIFPILSHSLLNHLWSFLSSLFCWNSLTRTPEPVLCPNSRNLSYIQYHGLSAFFLQFLSFFVFLHCPNAHLLFSFAAVSLSFPLLLKCGVQHQLPAECLPFALKVSVPHVQFFILYLKEVYPWFLYFS